MAIPKLNDVLYELSDVDKHVHADPCCSYVCTIVATKYGIDITKKYTDVYVCFEQSTIILRHGSEPDNYTSSGNLGLFASINETVRDEVFRKIMWRQ